MRIRPHLFASLLALVGGLHAQAALAADKKAWITIGDAAFHEVRKLVPDLASVESRQLAVGAATVHVVGVSEAKLETIAGAIHRRLQQCGGFLHHKSESVARAALQSTVAAGAAPAHVIAHRELVEPVLAQMSDQRIADSVGHAQHRRQRAAG